MARRLRRIAGSVITLRNRRKVAGHAPQRLCRVTLAFECHHCGREFLASVVAIFDPHKYRSTDGVGERLTPDRQLPRWCPPPRDCKNAARRKPTTTRACALDGCERTFKVAGKSNKRYCCVAHQEEAASRRKAAKRVPLEPSIEFDLVGDIVERVADMLALDPDRAARREAADAATAVRQRHEQNLKEAEAAMVMAMSKAEELTAKPYPVSPAPGRLAKIDEELAGIADARPVLSTQLSNARAGRGGDAAALKEEQDRLLERLRLLNAERLEVEADVEAAPGWEAEQVRHLNERRQEAAHELAAATARLTELRDGRPLELDRVGVDVDDVPEPVDPEGEDLEERERQHLHALARGGDDEARGRLLSQFGGRS